jgi:hypothetical protein
LYFLLAVNLQILIAKQEAQVESNR